MLQLDDKVWLFVLFGISIEVVVEVGGVWFVEFMLIIYWGLFGLVMLQVFSFWMLGYLVIVDWLLVVVDLFVDLVVECN